jgi:hypothetical protein
VQAHATLDLRDAFVQSQIGGQGGRSALLHRPVSERQRRGHAIAGGASGGTRPLGTPRADSRMRVHAGA